MSWTKAQQYTIESRNESLIVSAAAGSGKTSVLVERVTGLLEDGADLNRMLIVTFTNAAAAEMKERIAKKLGSNVVRHSHISTFHKFAIDIIRKYYYVTGVNPSLSICDEYKQSILKNKAMDEMFEELFEKDDEQFIDFLNCYASAKDNRRAKELIFEFFRFLQSFPDPNKYISSVEDGSAFDTDAYLGFAAELAYSSIKKVIAYNNSAIDILLNPEKDGAEPMPMLAEKLKNDGADFGAIKELLEKGDFTGAVSLVKTFAFQRFAKTKNEKASYVFVEDEVEALRKALKKEFEELKKLSSISKDVLIKEKEALKSPLCLLCRFTRIFTDKYNKKKTAEGIMDFSDVEHFAVDILKNDDVCNELRNSFDYIFVDEYQDSNLIQDELIFRIARNDNVFLVGDVKQSIYKFRLAEPELFIEKYNRFKSGLFVNSKAVDLNSNFRSKLPVIKTINDEFEFAMRLDTVGMAYDEDAALKEGNPYDGPCTFEPELYILSEYDDGSGVDEAIADLKRTELEALSVANIIRKYHGATIFDSKTGTERALNYSDMVILLRAVKSKGEIFYQTLERAGIPVFLERGEGYFDTPEIQVLINLLKIIDNFKEDVPLISVLHFPSFGFDAEMLAKIRIFSNGKGYFKQPYSEAFRLYASEGDDSGLKAKAKSFIEKINLWRKKAAYLPLDEFIWELLSESGIASFAAALPSGVQRSANLRALTDKAFEYEQQGGGGLYGFISYIEVISKKANGVETGQISVIGEGTDAVRIMTIHKSKGLEFPFVLVAGLGSKFAGNKNTLSLALHKDFGASIRIVEPKKGIYTDPVSLKLIALKRKREEMAETIRLLYVAMTRAKDILIMSAAVKDAEKVLKKDRKLLKENVGSASDYLDMILPVFDAKHTHIISRTDLSADGVAPSVERIYKAIDEGFEIKAEDLPISADEIKSRLNFDYSADPYLMLKRKYSVSEIAQAEREKKKDAFSDDFDLRAHRVPKFMGEAKLDAASKGTAYHNVMEHIPFTPDDKDAESIAAFIEELRKKNIITAAEAEAVEPERIAGFFESEIGKRAIAAKEIYKEAPFVLKAEYEGREVYIQGTIDCYFKEGDEYILVDYKSNYIDTSSLESEKERLRDEYVPQLKLYRKALESITGTGVKEGILYLFGINDIIRVC